MHHSVLGATLPSRKQAHVRHSTPREWRSLSGTGVSFANRTRGTMRRGEVLACNCSRCGRLGSLLAFAPATQFKLLSGDADLTKFEFNKHMIHIPRPQR